MKETIHCTSMLLFVVATAVATASCASSQKKKDNNSKQEEPKLIRPEVKKVWVPDRISGEEYEAGHWKYVIQKNSSWTKED